MKQAPREERPTSCWFLAWLTLKPRILQGVTFQKTKLFITAVLRISNLSYWHVSGVPWLIITGSGLDDWIYWHTCTQFGTTGNYSSIAILHTFQFTVANALGFSVFTSRILATDLSQSHCIFNSHMTSSWYSLIPFLPFPAAANSEDLTQFSSDNYSVFLQLLNSQFLIL
jgi:hypothetical protein